MLIYDTWYIRYMHSFYHSNGVGRTGVFMLVYTGMQEMDRGSGIINILDVAKKMFLQRRLAIREKYQLKYVYEAILYYAQDILAKRELLQIRLRGNIVLRTGYTGQTWVITNTSTRQYCTTHRIYWPNVSYYKYVYEAILYYAQDILAKRELLQIRLWGNIVLRTGYTGQTWVITNTSMRQYCTTHRIYWLNVSYYKYVSYYEYVYEAILYYAQDILAKRELLQIRLWGNIVLRTGYTGQTWVITNTSTRQYCTTHRIYWLNVSYYKYVYEAILYYAQDILAKRELLQICLWGNIILCTGYTG